jgi:hypothetical protein
MEDGIKDMIEEAFNVLSLGRMPEKGKSTLYFGIIINSSSNINIPITKYSIK